MFDWMEMEVKQVWSQLERWFQQNYPEMVVDLRPGCSVQDLDALELKLGIELPESFRSFYIFHEGQNADKYIGLFYNISLMPLGQIQTAWKMWSEIIDEYGPEGMAANFDVYQLSLMPDKVRAMYANKKWVPFAVIWDSNYLGLDFDPAPNGKLGQVINFGREEEQKAVLADSFEEFVQRFVKDLEDGKALINSTKNGIEFLPKKFEWRFRGIGTRLGGYVAHRFIEEPTREEQERLGIPL